MVAWISRLRVEGSPQQWSSQEAQASCLPSEHWTPHRSSSTGWGLRSSFGMTTWFACPCPESRLSLFLTTGPMRFAGVDMEIAETEQMIFLAGTRTGPSACRTCGGYRAGVFGLGGKTLTLAIPSGDRRPLLKPGRRRSSKTKPMSGLAFGRIWPCRFGATRGPTSWTSQSSQRARALHCS